MLGYCVASVLQTRMLLLFDVRGNPTKQSGTRDMIMTLNLMMGLFKSVIIAGERKEEHRNNYIRCIVLEFVLIALGLS